MSKKTRRMKRAAEEKINRKDAAISQHNEELENLKEQYEGLDICDEDKKVIDNYIACKDARAERMAEKLYEKGMKDVKRRIRIRKLIRRCVVGQDSENVRRCRGFRNRGSLSSFPIRSTR